MTLLSVCLFTSLPSSKFQVSTTRRGEIASGIFEMVLEGELNSMQIVAKIPRCGDDFETICERLEDDFKFSSMIGAQLLDVPVGSSL